MKHTILVASALTLILSCRQQTADNTMSLDAAPVTASQPDANVLKVYVEKNGTIYANGAQVTITDLENELKKLKERNGVVWYSRDNLSEDPSREAMVAVDEILEYELTVKFYADKEFTKPADL